MIGEDFAQELIDYTDKIYLEFGADPHVEGVYEGPDIKDIRKRAIQAGLQLVDCATCFQIVQAAGGGAGAGRSGIGAKAELHRLPTSRRAALSIADFPGADNTPH